MPVDYHMHTVYSDGKGKHADYIAKAQELGLTEIGFSEHICFMPVRWAVHDDVIDDWVATMQNLRTNSPLPVRFGVEMDYLEGKETQIADFLQKYDFDYVHGSVHFIDEWNFDVNSLSKFDEYDIMDLYQDYFRLVQKAARSGLFDVMSHADLIKKFDYRPKNDISEIYRATARAFRDGNVVYEINTSGKNKKCAEFYPIKALVEACFAAGVPVTLGSDAHKPEEVGQHFEEAIALLKEVGYTEVVSFKNRQRKMVAI